MVRRLNRFFCKRPGISPCTGAIEVNSASTQESINRSCRRRTAAVHPAGCLAMMADASVRHGARRPVPDRLPSPFPAGSGYSPFAGLLVENPRTTSYADLHIPAVSHSPSGCCLSAHAHPPDRSTGSASASACSRWPAVSPSPGPYPVA